MRSTGRRQGPRERENAPGPRRGGPAPTRGRPWAALRSDDRPPDVLRRVHVDFADAAAYLGEAQATTAPIRFGRDGVPFYVAGPYDDPRTVLTALESSVGAGNFHYLVAV